MNATAEISMNKPKKTIEVVAAIIIEDGKLFATQRGYGEWKDWWEFPGGKIEGAYVHENENPSTLRQAQDKRYSGQARNESCGKWIPTESPQEALKREIREELQTEIEVGELLTTVEYDYPGPVLSGAEGFHLSMQCFLCSIISGQLSLLEHEDARWLAKDELNSVKWLPADLEILPLVSERL